jgi:hypothetical protein
VGRSIRARFALMLLPRRIDPSIAQGFGFGAPARAATTEPKNERAAGHYALGAALLPCCVVLLCAQAVSAEPTSDLDRTTARELGREALVALSAGDYATAEERLDRALSLHVAPTLYLARARARQALGKLLSAAEDYRAVLRFTDAPEQPKSFAQARLDARTELDRLEPRLPYLTLLAQGAPGRVTVNGTEWPAAALGIARPLDPGAYAVEVTSASGATKTYRVLLDIGQRRQLSLPADATAPPPPPLTAAGLKVEPVEPAAPKPNTVAHASDHTATYVWGTATLILAAGAIASGIVALDRSADFKRRNLPEVGMEEKQRLHSAASTWAWVNTGLWAATLATAGVTTYVFFTTGDSESKPVGLQLGATGRF